MMKNILSIAVLLAASAVVLTGCKNEEDDLFSSSAAERLSESQVTLTKRLSGTAWVMEYYPLGTFELDPETRDPYPAGLGYVILNRFNADGSVEQAMQNAVSLNYYINDTSLWQIISDQGPVLSFNTFNNCIHTFSDPGVNNSTMNLYQGRGYEGDYEFGVLDMKENADVVMLKGKKRGTYIRMVKLPFDTDFKTYLSDVNAFTEKMFSASAPNNSEVFLGDTTFVMTKASKGIAELYPVGGDPISQSTDHVFTITQRNGKYYMRFLYNIGRSKCDAREFVYSATEDKFICLENSAYSIQGPPAGKFFNESMIATHKWLLTRTSVMSDQMKTVYETMYNDFRKVGSGSYTLQNVQFSKIVDGSADNGKIKVDISYRNRNSVAHLLVYFDATFGDQSFTLSNRQVQGNGQNIINAVPGIDTFLTTIETELSVAAGGSSFNMSTLKLTSAKDTNYTFVLNYII